VLIGIHIHVADIKTHRLKEPPAELVSDNDRAEPLALQGPGKDYRAQRAVGLRMARHIEPGGEEDGPPRQRQKLPGRLLAVVRLHVAAEHRHSPPGMPEYYIFNGFLSCKC